MKLLAAFLLLALIFPILKCNGHFFFLFSGAPGNDAANAKPWTVLLFSVFMVALGFAFAH